MLSKKNNEIITKKESKNQREAPKLVLLFFYSVNQKHENS